MANSTQKEGSRSGFPLSDFAFSYHDPMLFCNPIHLFRGKRCHIDHDRDWIFIFQHLKRNRSQCTGSRFLYRDPLCFRFIPFERYHIEHLAFVIFEISRLVVYKNSRVKSDSAIESAFP